MGSDEVSLVLASASPRRRELIEAMDLPVELLSPHGREEPPMPLEAPEDYTLRLSLDKASQGVRRFPNTVVIGADTSVVFDDEILGKPADAREAKATLYKLRNGPHTVVTGLTVYDGRNGHWESAIKRTGVWMRDYSDREVASYVRSGRPLDKAGSYAIQDAEFQPVSRIDGCYLNVVGLPLCALIDALKAHGIHASLKSDWQAPEQCLNCELRRRQA